MMKTNKPRNYIQIALSRRSGSGAHQKTYKQKRSAWKQEAKKLY